MRFLPRLSWFALLGVLAVVFAVAPSNVAAQASSPAATSAAAPAANAGGSGTAQSSQVESPEEQQINGFLHAPAVKAIANALHLKLETADGIFLAVNFAILFLAIAIPLGRTTPRILHKRSKTLRHNLDSARKLSQEAKARLTAVEAQLSKIGQEIDKFRAEVEEELKQDEARIKGAIEEESVRIVTAAEQEIGVAAAQARRSLRSFAADLAIEHAAGQIVLTPETDRALIAEFASGLAQNHTGLKGGQH